ncbi:hypothetical protein GCM10009060_28430 [Halorubrum trapanicum]
MIIDAEFTFLLAIDPKVTFTMVHLRAELLKGCLDALLGHFELPIISKCCLMPEVDILSIAYLDRASTY